MSDPQLNELPHRRLNALTGDYVLVSPQRTLRPWQGGIENIEAGQRPGYDANCYLCPGNRRAGGERNPAYADTFVFTNDFPALRPDIEPVSEDADGLLSARAEPGTGRVVCFSPRHDLTLAEMEVADIARVVDVWTREYRELGARDNISHVQIFENKGTMMGCSNPHPHGQIWAQQSIPGEPARELARMAAYFERAGRTLLADYLALELEKAQRTVCENRGFVALVPYWAVWPFETLLLPKRDVASLSAMNDDERFLLADIISRITVRYDNLFRISFPYSAGMHQAPTDGGEYPYCTWHMHFLPPLLRSATVRKFMVGYEMLAEPQRDITAETSAAMLRDVPAMHYRLAKRETGT